MFTLKEKFRPFSRNYMFIAVAVLVTLYGLFVASAFDLRVYSIGVLVLLIPFLEIRSHQTVIQLFFIFFICVQISSISVFDRLPYQLLMGSQPFWKALQYALPIAFGTCTLAYLFFYKNANLLKLYGIQFPIMIVICTWYVRMILILNNCQHIPNEKTTQIRAVVIQKCPTCCDIHELWFSFKFEGKDQQAPIDVDPKLYARTKQGDTLMLQMHPGVYGWLWYHKDLKRRYK